VIKLLLISFRSLLGRILDTTTVLDHLFAKRAAPCQLDLIEKQMPSGKLPLTYVVIAALSPDESRKAMVQAVVKELSSIEMEVIVLTRVPGRFDGANAVYHWKNSARDFFAYKNIWGLYLSTMRKTEPIFFLNDSVSWKSGTLSKLISSIKNNNEVVIPTESLQVFRHAQPYFFYIPSFLSNRQIQTLLEPARAWRWKRTAVRRGEFLFLSTLVKHEIPFRFLVDHQEMHEILNNTCEKIWFLGCRSNPTRALRDYLEAHYGFHKVT